jgi:hypothetical protein
MVPPLPHFLNIKENMGYVGPIPDISCYRADAMSDADRREFLEWYETQKMKIFNKRRVLEEYCQAAKLSDVNSFRSGKWTFSWNL